MEITDLKRIPDLWENFVSQNRASGFLQSLAWAHFESHHFREVKGIGLLENGMLQAGAVVHRYIFHDGFDMLYIPQGPVLDYFSTSGEKLLELILQNITKLAKKSTTHIRLEPRLLKEETPNWFSKKFQKAFMNLQPRFTHVIDLTLSAEEISAQMKPKGRYNIRLAKKHGVHIHELLAPEGVDVFNTLYRETRKRQQFGVDCDAHIKLMATFLPSHMLRCFLAFHEGKPLASALTIDFGKRRTYYLGASTDEKKNLMAPSLLQYEMMLEAKQHGISEYDLWGVSKDENDRSDLWYGISRFKSQFGGKRLELIGAHDFVLNPTLYQKFIAKYEWENVSNFVEK